MSTPEGTAWLAKLEVGRVQTYLFAVPELRAMVGANALLGEVLRGQLTEGGALAGEQNLPALAARCGAGLPAGVANTFPGPVEGDPLAGRDRDDPKSAAAPGVLARDGGHFHAVFADKAAAETFIRRAQGLVARRLPGLSLSARLVRLTRGPAGWTRDDAEHAPAADDDFGESPPDLPQTQVCQVSGQGPAAGRDDEGRFASATVRVRRDTAEAFDDGKTNDVLGLLRGPLVRGLGLAHRDHRRLFPAAFNQIAPEGGYLAVIVADGNGMGDRFRASQAGAGSADFFVREAHGEKFFQSMRVAVRKAVPAALKSAFAGPIAEVDAGRRRQLPFRLMMLGGDDLLLVCDAGFALPFVVEYAKVLRQHNLTDGKPLEVGVGVAIVNGKFPFHRSHALAEQLAGSAKRLSRGGASGSVVDWLVLSEAWHEEVGAVRKRDFVKRYGDETLLLSRKPYRVLGEGQDDVTLQRMVTEAGKAVGKVARSQLMDLAEQLSRGREQASWAYRQMSSAAREALSGWLRSRESVWTPHGGSVHSSSVLDFLEVFELERMRADAARTPEPRQEEVASR